MKKLLPLLILSFGFMSSAYSKICDETSTVQKRNGYLFLSNQTQLFSGENICIYENGQYKVQGEYTNGLKDGKWTWWHENGQKKEEGNYKDGKRDGKWVSWSEDGKKEKEEFYKDGKLID